MKELPSVSVIIPCRNEEKHIGSCLDSILANNYPVEKIEILVTDGLSQDRTPQILGEYSRRFPFIKILINEKKTTPDAMNLGIRNSRGELITIINSHAIIDINFLIKSVSLLHEKGVEAVGGKLNTINEGKGILAECIPIAADSIFGSGGKRYRTGQEPGLVKDTLPYCMYRRNVFSRIGLIDEELLRDQDEEFNYRLLRSGGKIFFSPEIKSLLYLRPSLNKLWRQHFQYGYFKVKVAQKIGTVLTWRQLIPALFVSSLILISLMALLMPKLFFLSLGILALYEFTNAAFSLSLSVKYGIRRFAIFILVFNTLHFSYGLGYLKGVIDFLFLRKDRKNRVKEPSLTR